MSPPATPKAPPRLFDRDLLVRRRDTAAPRFEDYSFLKARVSRDLIDRLDDTSHTFRSGLELGGHDGGVAGLLQGGSKVAAMRTTDPSPGMVAQARARGLDAEVADEEALPYDPASFDLVVSALSLHWVNDLPGALVQVRRVLEPDGLFLGALFGAGTLAELRTCLTEAESELMGGLAPRLSPLPALSDMAALMQRAGFALPVVDRESVTVRYDSVFGLLADLKGMGERAAFTRGMGQPLPRRVLMRMAALYAERFSDQDGRVRATFEIVFLSGWAPAPSQPKPLKPGSATVSLADAVRRQSGES
jgi:NADH dehydrogenase [ubiquinone] 1 alpha subcomplex assembly factor 5